MSEEEFKKPTQFKAPDVPKLASPPPPPPQPCAAEKAPFKYEEPSWSSLPPPEKQYQLEVIKGGTAIEPVDLSKRPFFIVGRMSDCQLSLQHPSLSRYHAVLQHCSAKLGRDPTLRDGWYIQDLGSSNGTVVNKKRLDPMTWRPIEIGHVIKFGMSTRIFVLQGKQDQKDTEESETTISNPMKIPLIKKPQQPPPIKVVTLSKEKEEGCMWGISMDDDAVYESGDVDPNFEADSSDSSSEGEEGDEARKQRKPLDLSDPKKTLRVFYEREDLGLPDYQVENIGKNRHRAFIEIPTSEGKMIRVEGEGGSKKEAVADCAREACISLDKMDLLRPKNKTGRKKEVGKDWAANDYYDEDEDSFYDRTGDLERKRLERMKREKSTGGSGSSGQQVHTEQSLQVDFERLDAEVRQISTQLEEDEAKRAEFTASRGGSGERGELDALDAYMSALKHGVGMDATTRVRLKHRLLEAQKERSRCARLLSIAKGPKLPASLMANAWQQQQQQQQQPTEQKQQQTVAAEPSVGKLRSLPPIKIVSSLPKLGAFEEDDDDDEPKRKKLAPDVSNKEEEKEEKDKLPLETEEKMEMPPVSGEGEEEDGNDRKVYGVFLPPELRQSLDEHADEVDQIWDIDRANRLATAKASSNDEDNNHSTTK